MSKMTVSAQAWCCLCRLTAWALGLSLALPDTATAAPVVPRIAVIVGNNIGAKDDVPLRFAQRDARRVAQVLRELGDFKPESLNLLLEPTAVEVEAVLHRAARQARAHRDGLLVFYYSGHAGQEALHLGSTKLDWTRLRQLLSDGDAGLRVAIVDACQAGMLTVPKGFMVDEPTSTGSPRVRGYAMMVAAGAAEAAQESLALGGSYFTHFLVSALRGAADTDGDGRVTLTEANSYANRYTRRATISEASTVQHPAYRFDISGHGDVMLTDLRTASASLRLGKKMAGHVVVTERGSSLVAAETDKAGGRHVTLALPNGRYVVHLRKPHAVYLEEVALPWGGLVDLQEDSMTPETYQAVAHKGGLIEVYANRARLAVVAQSGILPGMGVNVAARLEVGRKLAAWEVSLRAGYGQQRFAAVDTHMDNRIYRGGLALAYERPVGVIDLRLYSAIEGLYWLQQVHAQGLRHAIVMGVTAGGAVRVPVAARIFAEISVESTLYAIKNKKTDTTLRQTIAAVGTVGWMF